MGITSSSSALESAHEYGLHLAHASRTFARTSWVRTNDVCAHSCCSVIWPAAWAAAAEDSDIAYLPVGSGGRGPQSGEQYQFNSNSPAMVKMPTPYLSSSRDRALYTVEDDESDLSSSPSSAVPHYSYRPDFGPHAALPVAHPVQPQTQLAEPSAKSPKRSKHSKKKKKSHRDSEREPADSHPLSSSPSTGILTTPSPDPAAPSPSLAISPSPPPPIVPGVAPTPAMRDRVDVRDIVGSDDELEDGDDGVLVASPTAAHPLQAPNQTKTAQPKTSKAKA